jgi:hypothetical protein
MRDEIALPLRKTFAGVRAHTAGRGVAKLF